MTRVCTCIIYSGKVYKFGKNEFQQRRAGVAEWSRAWAGGTVIMGSNPASFMKFFFLSLSKNMFKFFGGLSCRYLKRKISGTGAETVHVIVRCA